MRRLIANIISIIYTFFKFIFIKIFHIKGFSFKIIERFSPNVVIEMGRKSVLQLGKKVRAHSGCIFKIRKKAQLKIGNDVSFNYGCKFFCHNSITIEKGVEFGPDVKIYDHDHDFRAEGGLKAGKFNYADVYIGENAWIGANVIILKGANIGKNAVIAAGSIVKGNVPENTVYIQKRTTEIKEY